MAFCRECGGEFKKEELSRRGLCKACAYDRMSESVYQIIDKRGPFYDKYVAGLARAGRKVKAGKG